MLPRRAVALRAAFAGPHRTYFANTLSAYEDGVAGTKTYRVRVANSAGDFISPWHDIPLATVEGCYNLVVEIPKGTRAKYEVATQEEQNPIKLDRLKNGDARLFPFRSLVNYGMLPQTWEDSSKIDPRLKAKGDNDPLDVCEIGSKIANVAQVYPVKVLGALSMIDGGEADWKIIAIRMSDPLAALVNDIDDVPAHFGDILPRLTYWFKTYKRGENKPPATGFDLKNAAFAKELIAETHQSWKVLVDRQAGRKPPLTFDVEAFLNKPLWTPL